MKVNVDKKDFERMYKYLKEQIIDECDIAFEMYDLDGYNSDLEWSSEMEGEYEKIKKIRKKIGVKDNMITIEEKDLEYLFKMFLDYVMMYGDLDVEIVVKKGTKKRYFVGENKDSFLEFLKEMKWCKNFNEKYNLDVDFDEYFCEFDKKNIIKRFMNEFQYRFRQYVIPKRVKDMFRRNIKKFRNKNLHEKEAIPVSIKKISRQKAISLLIETKDNFITYYNSIGFDGKNEFNNKIKKIQNGEL